MRRLGYALAFCLLLLRQASADMALPGLIQEFVKVPIRLSEERQVNLEAMVVRPDRPGRFPVVILVHGTPAATGEAFRIAIAHQAPTALANPAVAFAQRGYAAVSIMRRGFGHSEGPFAERLSGPCNDRDYLAVGHAAAEDVSGAVVALRSEPWADPDRVLLFGHSTGGFAVIVAAANNTPGVIGVLDFAGGHGSAGSDHVCSPDRLVEDAGILGRTTRVPALWIHAENDHYIPAPLARRMFESYTAAGAPAQLEMLPPFGVEGHRVATGPVETWWPAVEGFLSGLRLPVSVMVELPPLVSIPAPSPLNAACAMYFNDYVATRTDAKAFAWNAQGHCSLVIDHTADEARQEAMRLCVEAWKDCSLYAVGQSRMRG
ncbi:alpha/beta hydrolase family protein [Bradyrhizobium sp. ORS 86]|uniref:alpha/beta hydrolase family protein n=1 Tax=Bradyrhizobium sp. ORS 86 TaxID=1685970 RepID=UPI00388E306A